MNNLFKGLLIGAALGLVWLYVNSCSSQDVCYDLDNDGRCDETKTVHKQLDVRDNVRHK